LAKARLNTKSMKGSSLVAVRDMLDQFFVDSGYTLGQYMDIKPNLPYKSWTADLRRRRRKR
jgi:hypothetical protein